jgi:hypothetical protein
MPKFKWQVAGSSQQRTGINASVGPISFDACGEQSEPGAGFAHYLRLLLPIINPTMFYIHLSWNAGTLDQTGGCSNKGFRLTLLLQLKTVTNFTEHTPSWETSNRSRTRQIPLLSQITKAHYHRHKRSPLATIPRQVKVAPYALLSCSFKSYCDVETHC